MPTILVDNREMNRKLVSYKDCVMLLDEIRNQALVRGRIVTEATLNGEPCIDWTSLSERPGAVPEGAVLEVRTEDAKSIGVTSLTDAVAYMASLHHSCGEIAACLRGGNIVDGCKNVATMFDGLSWIAALFGSLIDIFRLDERNGAAVEPDARAFLSGLSELVSASIAAQERQDWSGLADLIEHDLVAFLERSPEIIARLECIIESCPKDFGNLENQAQASA